MEEQEPKISDFVKNIYFEYLFRRQSSCMGLGLHKGE